VLKWVSRLECVTIFLSIDFVLRLFRFSADFRQRMVYPLVALFFGTGNQTPKVSAAVIARVFLDKSLAIFEYDAERLLNQTPNNIAFDDLESFYGKMKDQMVSEHCHFRFGTEVRSIERGGGAAAVRLHLAPAPSTWRGGSGQLGGESPLPEAAPVEASDQAMADGVASEAESVLEVDELILATPANVSRRLLGRGAGFFERRVLSSVEYFDDLTVTHTDGEYMGALNEVDGRAIYFIRTHPEVPECLEMGFEISQYQPRLQAYRKGGGDPIYQTIFLDRQRSDLWSIDRLNPSKVLDRAWWSAFSHSYKHFRRVVPWTWLLQGRKHTFFAGSWLLFNTHDIAIASGLAAAERLGAPYPFADNKLAAATYDIVLGVSHLRRRRCEKKVKKAAPRMTSNSWVSKGFLAGS